MRIKTLGYFFIASFKDGQASAKQRLDVIDEILTDNDSQFFGHKFITYKHDDCEYAYAYTDHDKKVLKELLIEQFYADNINYDDDDIDCFKDYLKNSL